MSRLANPARVALVLCLAIAADLGVIRVRADIVVEQYAARNILGFTTTGLYDPTEFYFVGPQLWQASLNPLHPVTLARGGTANFLAVLQAAFPLASGWSFVAAAANLTEGSLRVHSYDVKGSAGYVGIEQTPKVGFDVEYVPGAGDPVNNMHWIQVVTNNHALGGGGGHGVNANIVDIPTGQTNPYYDTAGAADSRNFLDGPGRTDGNAAHNWVADLYLVSGPTTAGTQANPAVVTVYNGVRWGWTNASVPEPAPLELCTVAGVLILAVRLRASKGRAAA
ncbi:MAG: hypothetical protein U0794_20605 [Isosphaeraceae bacterium]